ncbi:ABC transporter ATP-binding protein [Perlabentimonas gracilis]|uniref:ABC transporter ATP-binding protein n=1 Tax=Perlabentimonas gracilis TaxID=2715279 RepID=UPI001408A242|nr:ATP-binding cassette domain-containing protein [Perlabentimonas gracilis]NHB68572.1 ATP-binding cassette domain-containing protein [Perlabentimonas gracilis]
MIRVQNISKSFLDRIVLKDITARFESGKTNLIIGQSGSGKTVLMKSIVGLHEVDHGEIYYGDTLFNNLNFKEKKRLRQKVGMLFQGAALFDSATVEENVMYPLEMFTEMTSEEKLERANFCLQRVNMDNTNNLFPSELSGGMKKRVAIARAIALNPKYLFCDEPNSGLDPKTSILIDNLIKEITEEYGITTIVNTHDMNSVMGIGDNIIFIYQGEKWWEGTKEEILNSDNKELNEFVFASELAKQIRYGHKA